MYKIPKVFFSLVYDVKLCLYLYISNPVVVKWLTEMFTIFTFCSESPKGANDASTFQRKVCVQLFW